MHVIGYGNPGRGDDGLGPAFSARIAARRLPGLVTAIDFQLTVDHALEIAQARCVVFVDAMMPNDAPFHFAPVSPAPSHDLGSHSLSPNAVLALAATLFDAAPEAHVLGITGQEFGKVREGLSMVAEDNLASAEAFFLDWHKRHQASEHALGYADA